MYLLLFDENPVVQIHVQKPLEIALDIELCFIDNLKTSFEKTNNTLGLFRWLWLALPSPYFLTIYEPWMRPHCDYKDII